MKRAMQCLLYLLFVLISLFPAGAVLCQCFGYRFELANVPAFSIAVAAISVCAIVLDFLSKNNTENKLLSLLLVLAAPLSLIHSFFCILKCTTLWVILTGLISAVCCCYLSIKYGKPLILKLLSLVSCLAMVLPMACICLFASILGNSSYYTVVQTVESPNGKYCAQVISSDQGALGGNTFVDVCENELDFILFTVQKMPKRVYTGKWGEFDTIRVKWKDDRILVIDDNEYKIA